MPDVDELHYDMSIFSAKICSIAIEEVNTMNPDLFDGQEGEQFCIRLQAKLHRAALQFFREMQLDEPTHRARLLEAESRRANSEGI